MADAIPNDFVLKKGVVLTGANASGKSTFMKAVAINVILAQTINTCVAKNMKMPAIQVMTSMALRDDVLQGESYYMREIKYLKRMLDELETGEPMLFVIDEILKGTNTRERLAASNAILSYMVQKQGFLLIATHDLELVYALKNRYDTYYFDSQVHEKDIVFPYKIRRGSSGIILRELRCMMLSHFTVFKKLCARAKKRRCNCIHLQEKSCLLYTSPSPRD